MNLRHFKIHLAAQANAWVVPDVDGRCTPERQLRRGDARRRDSRQGDYLLGGLTDVQGSFCFHNPDTEFLAVEDKVVQHGG